MSRPKPVARTLAWFRRSSTQTRLLLAVKSAIAAGLAWAVANVVPGVAGEYPYYAPLGAIISMYPTIAQSAREGVQTLAGLALGAVIAVGFIALGRPTPLTVALAVGIAVLLSSARLFGAQRGWVATAALFVLLLGYSQADEYSFAYVSQMLIGVVIGLVVNFLFPPLYYSEGRRAVADARATIERRLTALAERLEGDADHGATALGAQGDRLRRAVDSARSSVSWAGESRRANPRARRYRGELPDLQHQLAAIERIARGTEELADIVEAAPGQGVHPDVRAPLASAITRLAEAMGAWNDDRLTPEHLGSADAALDILDQTVDRGPDRGAMLRTGMVACSMLQRIRSDLGAFARDDLTSREE